MASYGIDSMGSDAMNGELTHLAHRPRVHGGPDGLGPLLHDFSSNSNACGPCPLVEAAVREADARHYPDGNYSALRGQLASFHGVEPQRIVLAASASEFIFRVTAMVARQGGHSVGLPLHSYGDYAQAGAAQRLHVQTRGGQADLQWFCEPGSPHGGVDERLALLDTASPAVKVLDRAYEPLRLKGWPSLSPSGLDCVWQLWTPNKALGLTGVRAAYAIAPVHAAAETATMESLCPSWPIGAHGVAMLQAWVQAGTQDWLAHSLLQLREWKSRQLRLSEQLGWQAFAGDANFWMATPRMAEGCTLVDALARLRMQGIKLRDTTSFGLPGQVRISVQAPAAQDALQNAWQQLMKVSP